MLKAMVAAALFTFAAPAFGGAKDDVKDAQKDAVDTAKDKLGTDSGAEKAKRHAKRTGRDVKRKAPLRPSPYWKRPQVTKWSMLPVSASKPFLLRLSSSLND